MQTATIVADRDSHNAISIHSHYRILVTILRILALHQHRHHAAEILQSMPFATKIQTAIVRHGRHYQTGYLCRLYLSCLSYLYHRSLSLYGRLLLVYPSQDATLKIHAFIVLCTQLAAGISRPFPTAAINSYSLVRRQNGLCLLKEIALPHVNINSPCDVAVIKLVGCSHIKHDSTGIGYQLCKPIHIDIFIVLLAASRCQAKDGQYAR